MTGAKAKWTAIVLTCQNERAAQGLQYELELKRDKGEIDKDVILLTVDDPPGQVGSGGATLNALLVVAEHISAKQGYSGRKFPFDSCGRAFTSLPLQSTERDDCGRLITNFDLLLDTMTTKGLLENIFYRCKSPEITQLCVLPDNSNLVPLVSGVVWFSARVADRLLACHALPPLDSCTYLGVDSGSQSIQLSLFFDFMLATCSSLTEEDFISGRYGEAGGCSSPVGGDQGDGGRMQSAVQSAARAILWKHLRPFRTKAVLVHAAAHSYMDLSADIHHKHLIGPPHSADRWSLTNHCHSFVYMTADVQVGAVLLNSILGDSAKVGSNSVVSHCRLDSRLAIGEGSIVSAIDAKELGTISGDAVTLGKDTILETFHILVPSGTNDSNCTSILHSATLVLTFGRHDNLQTASTFCNESFALFLSRTGIKADELWNTPECGVARSLFNARLFPIASTSVGETMADVLSPSDQLVAALWLQGCLTSCSGNDILSMWRVSRRVSLDEVMRYVDVAASFQQRRRMFYAVGHEMIRETLLNCRNVGLNAIYRSAAKERYTEDILATLDKVGMECGSAGIAARALANIADVLGAMAGGEGGLRSGPACNIHWQNAFSMLESEQIVEGFRALTLVRSRWTSSPSHLVRAARHYEGAAQILIRHAVMSARTFIRTRPCDLVPANLWVTAECSARIDIAGGWSDTPPITYEHGGAVIDAAITVNNKKPIGAKCRRISDLQLVLHVENDQTVIVTELASLKDYNQPHAPGALLMAALICAEIIQYPSTETLRDQLKRSYDSGFEIYTWSNLPHGSGLGTSSILAGAIMAVLWRCSGKLFDIDSLNHAVLHLEQILTTGGGWQDQVGGLVPGLKVGHSKAELPLHIEVTFLDLPTDIVQAFSDRLVLVYTGKTRLARNLLQNVVRNWYARDPQIVGVEDALVANTWECAEAFKRGDLVSVGRCMSEYWKQKKVMAPGCEPEAVSRMMAAVAPHVLGSSLAGAGGGGFMYLLTKEPNIGHVIRDILATVQGGEGAEVYEASVDDTGLVITVEGENLPTAPIPFKINNC